MDVPRDERGASIRGERRKGPIEKVGKLVALERDLQVERIGRLVVAAPKSTVGPGIGQPGLFHTASPHPVQTHVPRDAGQPLRALEWIARRSLVSPCRDEGLLRQVLSRVSVSGQVGAQPDEPGAFHRQRSLQVHVLCRQAISSFVKGACGQARSLSYS